MSVLDAGRGGCTLRGAEESVSEKNLSSTTQLPEGRALKLVWKIAYLLQCC